MIKIKFFRPIKLPGDCPEKYFIFCQCMGCGKKLIGWGLDVDNSPSHFLCVFKTIQFNKDWDSGRYSG